MLDIRTNFKENHSKAVDIVDLGERSLWLILSFRMTINVAGNIFVRPSRREMELRSTELEAHDPWSGDVDPFLRFRGFLGL